MVKVGEPIATIEIENSLEASSETKPVLKSEKPENEVQKIIYKANKIIESPKNYSTKKNYSPLIISISKKEGLSESELEKIIGSGKEGRVTKNDLLHYLSSKNKSKKIDLSFSSNIEKDNDGIYEMSRMEKLISDHMIKSKN